MGWETGSARLESRGTVIVITVPNCDGGTSRRDRHSQVKSKTTSDLEEQEAGTAALGPSTADKLLEIKSQVRGTVYIVPALL